MQFLPRRYYCLCLRKAALATRLARDIAAAMQEELDEQKKRTRFGEAKISSKIASDLVM